MNTEGSIEDAPRVRYREGRPLTASDLNADEAALVALRRRHNLAHHTWGIVRGLELGIEGGEVAVSPGMAIDGYGRELFLTDDVILSQECLGRLNYPEHDVDAWLAYRLVADGVGRAGGRPSRRRVERTVLRLTPAPSGDAVGISCGAERAPSGLAPGEWPVYLGRIPKAAPSAAGAAGPSEAPTPSRPCFATLRGEQVVAPSKAGRLRVGMADDGTGPAVAVGFGAGDALVIDGRGKISIKSGLLIGISGDAPEGVLTPGFVREPMKTEGGDTPAAAARAPAPPSTGTTSTRSDLKIIPLNGTDNQGPGPPGVAFGPLAEPPKPPIPWRIYRNVVPNDPKTLPPLDQLRMEIFNPKDEGDPTRQRFIVRLPDAGNRLRPVLSVSADGTVTVGDSIRKDAGASAQPGFGDLLVRGQLVESPIRVDPNDPRFLAKIQAHLLQGAISSRFLPLLEVTISSSPASPKPGDQLQVSVTIKNLDTGTAPIESLQVRGTATIPGAAQPFPLAGNLDKLNPGESKPIDLIPKLGIPAGAQGQVVVALIALGVLGDFLAFGEPKPLNIPISQ